MAGRRRFDLVSRRCAAEREAISTSLETGYLWKPSAIREVRIRACVAVADFQNERAKVAQHIAAASQGIDWHGSRSTWTEACREANPSAFLFLLAGREPAVATLIPDLGEPLIGAILRILELDQIIFLEEGLQSLTLERYNQIFGLEP